MPTILIRSIDVEDGIAAGDLEFLRLKSMPGGVHVIRANGWPPQGPYIAVPCDRDDPASMAWAQGVCNDFAQEQDWPMPFPENHGVGGNVVVVEGMPRKR